MERLRHIVLKKIGQVYFSWNLSEEDDRIYRQVSEIKTPPKYTSIFYDCL